jgi:hypothetical protein
MPQGVEGRDPGEELVVGILAVSDEELYVDRIDEGKVRKGPVGKVGCLPAAGKVSSVARIQIECFKCIGSEIVERNPLCKVATRVARREIVGSDEFAEPAVGATDAAFREELANLLAREEPKIIEEHAEELPVSGLEFKRELFFAC